jgi:hypothetical protein
MSSTTIVHIFSNIAINCELMYIAEYNNHLRLLSGVVSVVVTNQQYGIILQIPIKYYEIIGKDMPIRVETFTTHLFPCFCVNANFYSHHETPKP